MTPLEAARWWIEKGFFPIPVPFGEKAARLPGWQKLRLTAESPLESYFNGARQNIGVLLGEPQNLVDVDLDAPEARWAWAELKLETRMIFGRRSHPESHYFYRAEAAARTKPFDDPLPPEGCEKRLLELRSLGAFQVVPPSEFQGDPYEFASGASGEPARVEKETLEFAVRATAAAVVAARHFRKGSRHHSILALAGACARSGWHEEQTENLIRALCAVIRQRDPEFKSRSDVRDTYQKLEEGKEFTGVPTLRNLLDRKVLDKLIEWLQLSAAEAPPKLEPLFPRSAGPAAPAPAPEPELKLEMHLLEELRGKVLQKPREMIESCIVRPSLTLVTAPSRSGKTILCVEMAMCVAAGKEFLGFKTEQAPALYVGWDDKQGEPALQDFLEKCRASTPGMPFHYILPPPHAAPFAFTFSNPKLLSQIKDKIEQIQAGLVIFDSYTAMRGPRASGEDIVKTEALEISALAEMARDLNFASLLIHHDSKSSAHLDWASRGAGSFAVTQSSEGVISIARYKDLPEGDPARLISIRHRRLRGAQFAVRFREETLDYDLIVEGAAAEHYAHLVELYREFRGVPFTQKQVSDLLGWPKTSAYRILGKFVASEVLAKDSVTYEWHPQFKPKGIL